MASVEETEDSSIAEIEMIYPYLEKNPTSMSNLTNFKQERSSH